jgi:chemotaxis protein histidine kinase CheA
MRIKQILVAFLFTALVISCEKTAKDINVSEIKTECEVVDAVLIVTDEVLELVEAVDSEEGASEAQKKEYKSLMEKVEELEYYFEESDFSKKAFKKCPKFEILDSKMAKANSRKTRRLFK